MDITEYDKCHCGQWTMAMVDDPGRFDFVETLQFGFCYDCALNRCDTSEGMANGCPNMSRVPGDDTR